LGNYILVSFFGGLAVIGILIINQFLEFSSNLIGLVFLLGLIGLPELKNK